MQLKAKSKTKGIKYYYRIIILKNIKVILMMLPIVLVLILLGITKVQDLTASRIEIEKAGYLLSIESLIDDMENNLPEVNERYITAKINKILTEKEILAYTSLYWNYSLEANNIPITEDSMTIEPVNSRIEIILTENKKFNPLPDSVMKIGSLSMGDDLDDLEKHIVFTDYEYEKIRIDQEDKTQIKYVFENVEKGQEINFIISFQLGSRIDNIFEYIKIVAG